MTTTVTALFSDHDAAKLAHKDICATGIDAADVSIVSNNSGDQQGMRDQPVDNNMAGTGAMDGAIVGGVAGGAAGLMTGLGVLAIPGIGPVVGAGWLLTTAVGATVGVSGGGLIGALIGAGVTKDDAQVYHDEFSKGGTLVSARVPDEQVPSIERIMQLYKGVDHRSFSAQGVAIDNSAPPPSFGLPAE